MDRFATPAFLASVTLAVIGYDLGGQAMVVFPMLDRVTRDPVLQGMITVLVLGCASGMSLACAGAGLALSAARRSPAPGSERPTSG